MQEGVVVGAAGVVETEAVGAGTEAGGEGEGLVTVFEDGEGTAGVAGA